jgi:protein O-mannosyl-transferase
MLAGTINRNAVWRNDRTLYMDVAAKSPDKGRSWMGMASLYPDDPETTRDYLMEGLAVDPDNSELHTNLGIALLKLNNPPKRWRNFSVRWR